MSRHTVIVIVYHLTPPWPGGDCAMAKWHVGEESGSGMLGQDPDRHYPTPLSPLLVPLGPGLAPPPHFHAKMKNVRRLVNF